MKLSARSAALLKSTTVLLALLVLLAMQVLPPGERLDGTAVWRSFCRVVWVPIVVWGLVALWYWVSKRRIESLVQRTQREGGQELARLLSDLVDQDLTSIEIADECARLRFGGPTLTLTPPPIVLREEVLAPGHPDYWRKANALLRKKVERLVVGDGGLRVDFGADGSLVIGLSPELSPKVLTYLDGRGVRTVVCGESAC
mgnify:CR=1 FL=1